ncbi:MAG: hypothetical protein IPN25_07520 [Sphingobacteriales bacterium]|nr:hypothetical protein [Sphingobacteriales bacterium]
MVGANIINHQVAKSGISYQEKWYIQRENQIKYHESLWGGCMIGAFGGCFALRASLYTPVPSHFRVDDLFLTLQIFEQNKKALFEPAAICYEDLPQNMPEELRRKRRIASGNFQNLAKFARLILPAYKKVAICFLSHKVLRWIGPFFLIIAWAASLFLYQHHLFYKMAFWLQTIGFGFPFIELLLQRFETSNKFVRFIAYFYQANLALLLGFFQYLKGVKTSVWKPTERTL